jgi:hypothetical protein
MQNYNASTNIRYILSYEYVGTCHGRFSSVAMTGHNAQATCHRNIGYFNDEIKLHT